MFEQKFIRQIFFILCSHFYIPWAASNKRILFWWTICKHSLWDTHFSGIGVRCDFLYLLFSLIFPLFFKMIFPSHNFTHNSIWFRPSKSIKYKTSSHQLLSFLRFYLQTILINVWWSALKYLSSRKTQDFKSVKDFQCFLLAK